MNNNNNNILWIGGISWLKKDNTYFPKATYPGIVSGSSFQQAIIEGIEHQGYHVKILSDCDMTSGERLEWSHNGKSRDIRVAGNGNKFLRIPKKIIEFDKEIKKNNILKGINFVFAYEMHFPYLFCMRLIKRINPNIKTVLICPDLSIYMDLDSKKLSLKALLKRIEAKFVKKYLKKIDGYILFTKQMYDYFAKYEKPYVVLEGVYSDKYSLNDSQKKQFIMHAGSLHRNVGIEALIEAFENIENSTHELWFFGSGAMDEYILEKSKKNKKIKHMGFVSPQELFEYEKQATLLVNVRDPKAEYTKYSFPSKTFEYMASGTPYLSTDLPGIPEEYKQYMFLIEDNKPETIRRGILNVLALTTQERNEFGEKARTFILKEKNKFVQSHKIIDFIDNQIIDNQE